MEFNLKGGVLMIGSLFWQDDQDNKRKSWRDENLEMKSVIDVKVPIRYGRFSSDHSYTMIFDSELDLANYGAAKVVPLKPFNFNSFNQMKAIVKGLSRIEGRFCDNFIKGRKRGSIAWCVCAILFKPSINGETRSHILENWIVEFKTNEEGYEEFSKDPTFYSLTKNGELDFEWPSNLTELDFIIATSTKPKNRPSVSLITTDEVAKHVKNREYFWPNDEAGISTFQDDEIKNILKDLD